MIHEFSPIRLHPLPYRSVRFFHTHTTPINARISRAKVITSPPASVRKPWLLWLGSWLWKDKPTCTTPQPSRITPTARMRENTKVGQIVNNSQRIVCGEGRNSEARYAHNASAAYSAKALRPARQALPDSFSPLYEQLQNIPNVQSDIPPCLLCHPGH